ncbi:Sec-independent protein translocase protein TatB [Pigmentiphaga litoralis]|uniref:Sec-independent protein translocase protein TatB n=1 Tax=Pigmentiphaga litoralis TaxID=516702 RepID=UPI003B438477
MFDVSFTEMLVIAVVALVVIGPERLPKVARTVGHLLGRAQRYVSDVKGDIRREMELDELRNLRSEMEEAARTIKSTVDTNVEEMRKELDHTTREVKSLADDAAHSASTASAAADVATDAAVHGGDSALLPEGVTGAPHAPHAPDAVAAIPNPAITPRDLPPGAPQVTPDPIVTLHADAASAPSQEPVPQASLFPSDVLPPVAVPAQADVAPAVADASQAADTHPAATPAARDREKA